MNKQILKAPIVRGKIRSDSLPVDCEDAMFTASIVLVKFVVCCKIFNIIFILFYSFLFYLYLCFYIIIIILSHINRFKLIINKFNYKYLFIIYIQRIFIILFL